MSCRSTRQQFKLITAHITKGLYEAEMAVKRGDYKSYEKWDRITRHWIKVISEHPCMSDSVKAERYLGYLG